MSIQSDDFLFCQYAFINNTDVCALESNAGVTKWNI
jgi:hypothetical protein